MKITLQNSHDMPIWKLSNNGIFTVGGAWNLLRHSRNENIFISKVWHKALPFKMSFITWRILLKNIPTDDMIFKFGIRSNLKCHCCSRIAQPENILHIFVNSPLIREVWRYFGGFFDSSGNFYSIQEALITWWSIVPCNPISALLIRICPVILTWKLWKTRCNGRFGKQKNLSPQTFLSNYSINYFHYQAPILEF